MVEAVEALYVHVPFCRALCDYCDFYSVILTPPSASAFVAAAVRELDAWKTSAPLQAKTIFVGGGTPTCLPLDALTQLLAACAGAGAPAGVVEFSVEANPATVTGDVADCLVRAGVNRVSIGAQSFDDADLHALGRRHAPEDVAQTVSTCRARGLSHVSLDLIFGVPGQSLASWRRTLAAALALEPEHLSCYGLTYEPETPLHDRLLRGEIERVDPDLEADMYEAAIDDLAAAGLPQYEISNFARPGCECRHNLVYWENRPYVGVGPAAAGFVAERRYRNIADVRQYVDAVESGASPCTEEETLDREHRARESAMLALRLRRGLQRREFVVRHGVDPMALFVDAIQQNVQRGLLEVGEDYVRLTRKGLLLADDVIADFLTPNEHA